MEITADTISIMTEDCKTFSHQLSSFHIEHSDALCSSPISNLEIDRQLSVLCYMEKMYRIYVFNGFPLSSYKPHCHSQMQRDRLTL